MKSLNGKVALITGGGSGIGKAAAMLLAKQGASVVLLDRHSERSKEVKVQIEQLGSEALLLSADVSDPHQMEHSFTQIRDHFNRLDIVFANAGINGAMNAIEHMEIDDWKQTLDVNLTGSFITLKYAIPHLKKQGGSVIFTSSINGNRLFSNPGYCAYSSSKAGQVAFMKMAALELASFGIRVNAINPGYIHDTNLGENTATRPEIEEIRIPIEFPNGATPIGQPGTTDQVAQVVLFLASDASSHVTGTEIYIDGAESLLRG